MVVYEKIPPLLFECSINTFDEKYLIQPRLVLETHGFVQNDISESFENKLWSLKVFSEDKNVIETLRRNLKSLKVSQLKVLSKTLKPSQWLTKWKTHWKPLSLTRHIDVIPAWYKDRYKTKNQVIVLDTLMSFGTGMHETTQLVAQFIEQKRKHLSSFLDIGTGTGILALVALKSGASDVTAMDISPLSIEASKSNLKVNGLKARLVLSDIAKLSSKNKYQMVAANLVTDDLLTFKNKIISLVKPGGVLIVSGISLDNLKRLKSGFKDLSLKLQKVSRGKEWAAILYAKKM